MDKINKVNFEIKKDEVVYKLVALKPDLKTQQKAQLFRAKKFGEFVKGGAPLQSEIMRIIQTRELFDETKKKELNDLHERIEKNEKIVEGKNKDVTKLSEMRMAAIQLRLDRVLRMQLLSEFSSLQNSTAESMAEDEKFNFYIANCIFHVDNNKPYFASLDDYLERSNDEDAETCASKYAGIYYGYDENLDHKLPENVFLKKYNMCNDQLKLLDNKGRLVDFAGKLINDKGEYIDDNGKVIEETKQEDISIVNDWTEVVSDKPLELTKEFLEAADIEAKVGV